MRNITIALRWEEKEWLEKPSGGTTTFHKEHTLYLGPMPLAVVKYINGMWFTLLADDLTAMLLIWKRDIPFDADLNELKKKVEAVIEEYFDLAPGSLFFIFWPKK